MIFLLGWAGFAFIASGISLLGLNIPFAIALFVGGALFVVGCVWTSRRWKESLESEDRREKEESEKRMATLRSYYDQLLGGSRDSEG